METSPLKQLIDAARLEYWDIVDTLLPSVAHEPVVFSWASEQGLGHPDGNIRDLAASVLEISEKELQPDLQEKLLTVAERDSNVYAQYRAAFALYKRGIMPPLIKQRMHEALQDKEVKAIAEKYMLER